MRTNHTSTKLAFLLLATLFSGACGDDKGDSSAGPPDLIGNNNSGGNNDGENTGGNTGDSAGTNGDNTGTSDGGTTGSPDETCSKAPKSSADFLNSCPPTGVERRVFDNVKRLPSNYDPGKPLPALP